MHEVRRSIARVAGSTGCPAALAEARFTRRRFLAAVVAGAAAAGLPRTTRAAAPTFEQAARESGLVYVSPLLADGAESTCHAEVWFVIDGGDLLVVTNRERWRAAAIARGLDRARLWVGDHGLWRSTKEAWRESPSADATARFDGDLEVRKRALALFGAKYEGEWRKWGPRFEKGLASGDRVLIRYTPAPAA